MAILERSSSRQFTSPPRPQLEVIQGISVVQDTKHMACLPGLGMNKKLLNGLANQFEKDRPDYDAEAVNVYNAGKIGSKNRLRKEKDVIKREADDRQRPGSIAGYSWGSLDALQIASELPEEVDEVVLLLSPHKVRKILSGNMATSPDDHIINAYSLLDPVALVGGRYKQADHNIPVYISHFAAVNPSELRTLVRAVAPHLQGITKDSTPEAA